MSSISHTQFKKDFYIQKILGVGNCAKVSKIKNKRTGVDFALKVIRYEQFSEFGQSMNEIEIIRSINDQAVPKLYHYYSQIMNLKGTKVYELGMIMEYCQKSLQQLIKEINDRSSKEFSQEQLWNFMKSMVRIFSKMQRLEILHRDIKPANILIKQQNGKNIYKVCDFGYSVKKSDYSADIITGTQQYVSPRVLEKFRNPDLRIDGINEKDDVYSLGKTILEIITGRNVTNKEIQERLFKLLRNDLDVNLVSILEHMLEPNENQRWDFIQLERKIKRIEDNKKADIIDLDNSMIDEQVQENFHKSRQLKSHYKKILSEEKHKEAKHIEIQTDQLLELTKKKQPKRMSDRYVNETKYLPNQVIQLSDSQTKYYLRERNFKLEHEIFCTLLVGDHVLLGMNKSLGVINLKENSSNVYVLRLALQQKPSMTSFNVVKIQETNGKIVLIVTADFFLHHPVEQFLQQINFLRDNHDQFLKKNYLKEVPINYRSFSSFSERVLNSGSYQIFQMSYNQMSLSQQPNCQMNCFEVAQQLIGVQNPALLGHRDGRISIFGKGTIYKDDESIRQMKVFGNNKLVFTSGNQIKMLEFLENASFFSPKNNLYASNLQSQIVHFRIIPKNQNIKYDEQSMRPFIQVYTYDARRIVFGSYLEIIQFQLLQRNAQINQICESSFSWSIEKEQNEEKEDFIVERKIIEKNQKQKGNLEQLYYATSSGLLKSIHDKRKVHSFSLKQPCGVHVTADKILFANYDGFVQILFTVTEDQKRQEEEAKKIMKAGLKTKGNLKKNQAFNQHQHSLLKSQHGAWRQPNNLYKPNQNAYSESSLLVTRQNYYSFHDQKNIKSHLR